ncbi:MAG: hypothetical protein HQ594_02070 [Candidatus Omnitrophica bacterium]|nr:hypothetical protein [Candidatus Omnitrophota bacterium]
MVDSRGFMRAAHLKYWKMPGGDKAVSEPWRMVLSVLGEKGVKLIKGVKKEDKELVLSMIEKNINVPLTSSAGRLFDAAAALLGVCTHASYEAEGPIKLEAICAQGIDKSYNFEIKEGECTLIDTSGLFKGICKDMEKGTEKEIIAAKFHNSMVEIILKAVSEISRQTGIKDIALSGGVFLNKYLRERVLKRLKNSNLRAYINNSSPVSDLNIALGQWWVVKHK